MSQGISRHDRVDEARAFYRAVYGRMQHTEGHHLPIWRGPGKATRWGAADDEDAYIANVANEEGGSVYTPVRLRATQPDGQHAYGGVKHLSDYTEAIFVDWDIAGDVKPDGSDGQTGYAADKDTLRGLLAGFEDATGIVAHAVVETPSGYHSWHLTDPMNVLEAADLSTRFDARMNEHLAEQGYKIDDGVTITPTRVGRAPGAFHSKRIGDTEQQTPHTLVRLVGVDDAPVTSLDALRELPRVLQGRKALPVVDTDLLVALDQLSLSLPVSRLLEVTGWTQMSGNVWTSPIEGASPDAGKLLEAADGAELMYPWSDRAAELLGVETGKPVSSASLVTKTAGDFRTAQRLGERAVADTSGGVIEEIVALFEAGADAEEFARLARQADAGWPAELAKQGQARLSFRGVAADVASAREYASQPDLSMPGYSVNWAIHMSVHLLNGCTGATTQANAAQEMKTGPDGGMKRGPGRPRKDGTDVKPAAEVFGLNDDKLRGLARNPLLADDVMADVGVPLVVVTQTEPVDDTDRNQPARYAQVQADAVLSAARHERLDLVVLHAPSWVSLFYAGGEGDAGSRDDRLHDSHRYVGLSGRQVYLVSRSTWRRDVGLVQYIALLEAKGAEVFVLDVPRLPSLRPAELVLDKSTWGVDDHLATHAGADPLRGLIRAAVPAEEARKQAHVPDERATAELADVVARSFEEGRSYLYDATSRRWVRDRGTHLQVGGAGTSPAVAVRAILQRHDVEVASVKTLSEVVRAVQDDSRVQISTSDLDRDGRELPVLNGIVDLHTGRLRKRAPGHLNSKVTPVVYDPDAKAPNWDKFLAESMLGQPEMVDYLQRIAGMALIGEMIEEKMIFFLGGGRNGKSVFLNTLAHVMGPYAQTMPVEMLASKPTPFQVGDLMGVRLLLAPEAPRGMRMSDGALKTFVSRDQMVGERKFGDSFPFYLSCTLISAVNHRPSILARDVGTWRRMDTVPWDNKVGDEDADRGLEPRLRSEAAGVLAWAVRGAMDLLAKIRAGEETGVKMTGGLLDPPPLVVASGEEHKASTDLLGAWMGEQCTRGPERRVLMAEVHVEFRAWLVEQEEKPWTPATIQQALEEVEILSRRTGQGRFYAGFDMTPPEDVEDVAEGPASGVTESVQPSGGGMSGAEVFEMHAPRRQPRTNGATALAADEEEL